MRSVRGDDWAPGKRSTATRGTWSEDCLRTLIVEDTPDDYELLLRALRRGGYDLQATRVETGEEMAAAPFHRAQDALAEVEGGARFDVILCDLMMPEMTGMELHAALVRRAPEQAEKMIFLTGGAFTARGRTFLDDVPNLRLEKPFDTRTLRALVNDRIR